jgi:outer membrane protein OmpA-like peptidoglycan-associated protein
MNLISKLLFYILFLSYPIFLVGKESPYYIGAEATYGLLNFDANFIRFDGIENCGCYETGSGNSLKARLFSEYRLFDILNIGFHVGYQTKNGILDNPDTAYARNLNTGDVELVQTNRELDVKFNAYDIGLDFNILIDDEVFNGPLYLNLSPSLHLQQSGSFTQTEVIDQPSGAAFKVDDKIFFERVNATGNFTTLNSSILNLSASLYNNMKIGHNLYLIQRIGVSNDMSMLLTDADISSFNLFGSLGIKLAFDEPKEYIPPTPPMSPLQPLPIDPEPTPIFTLDSYFDYIKSYIETGEKLVATPPLVLAVFFDKNSNAIRNKYLTSNEEKNPIDNHYHILDDIIEILNKYPKAKLELHGSTSGLDENNNLLLAKDRVINVKENLVSRGIDPNRIITTYSINPKVITNNQYEQGLAENRRVEIDLINANSVEFVKKTEFKKLYGFIDFKIEYDNITSKVYFKNNLMHNEQEVKSGIINTQFDRDLIANKGDFTINSELISNDFSKKDSKYVELDKLKVESVELKTDEFEALLMFDFASSNLTDETKILLKQLVELLPDGKTIVVIGNTDDIGLEEANKKIASERATNAINFIKSNTNKTFYFEEITNTDKYDETTPQGRYLNRSIIIRIK